MIRPAAQDRVIAALAAEGYAVEPDYLDAGSVGKLRERLRQLATRGQLVPAGVGRGKARTPRNEIRGDHIRWLAEQPEDAAETGLFDLVEALRGAVNRDLLLGLLEFEGHYACYPAGAHYAPHRDRFRDDDSRVLSLVLYLNELVLPMRLARLHLGAVLCDVMPAGGTLVVFLFRNVSSTRSAGNEERMAVAGGIGGGDCD
jgi:SM-20-related protein